jgi:membrane associated rhomboid family serine protease
MGLRSRLLLPLLILGVPWGQELVDQLLFGGRWNLPLLPRGPMWGILTAPFSHAGFGHLLSNSLWFLPLSWLVLTRGLRPYLRVWGAVLVCSLPVWLLWHNASHGLSGVVYGLLGYLLAAGLVERRPWPILLSLGCLSLYGGLLPSLIPVFSPAGVSWIGHASGFVAGVLAAWLGAPLPEEPRDAGAARW